jgi:hypothetical protein
MASSFMTQPQVKTPTTQPTSTSTRTFAPTQPTMSTNMGMTTSPTPTNPYGSTTTPTTMTNPYGSTTTQPPYNGPTLDQQIAMQPPSGQTAPIGMGFYPQPGTSTPGGTPTQTTAPQWSLPSFSPTPYQPSPAPPPKPAGQGGVLQDFYAGGGENMFNPEQYVDPNNPYSAYINSTLPVAQFGQNAYQWQSELDSSNQHWDAEFGETQSNNQFQQQLSTQQQLAAEQQAAIAAGQWNQQFGHTQYMDTAGLGLSQQEINNNLAIGLGQNQANMYGADQQLAGTLGSAGIYAGAQNYGADQQLAGTLGSANIYAGAQNYGADQQLAGTLGAANIYGGAQMYGADQQLAGTMGSAGLYSGAQIYQSDQELAAAKYQWDMQMLMNQNMMANNLQVANIGAYGRSQAPQMNWARSWS